jgi:plastocyanin
MRATLRLWLAAVLLFHVPALGEETGTIKGQILLDGESPLANAPLLVRKGDPAVKDAVCAGADIPNQKLLVDPKTGGIANIAVYLKKAPANMPAGLKNPPDKPLTFDQLGCQFLPRMMSVRVGQTVNCVTQDATSHNVHTSGFSNESLNFLIPANSKVVTPVRLTKAETLPMRVNCDLHSWMEAYWVVTDHPYVAITDERGEFSIADLPVGDHAFTVWHETGYVPVGSKTLNVTVKPGQQSLPPIKVSAAHFEAKLNKRP